MPRKDAFEVLVPFEPVYHISRDAIRARFGRTGPNFNPSRDYMHFRTVPTKPLHEGEICYF